MLNAYNVYSTPDGQSDCSTANITYVGEGGCLGGDGSDNF